MHRSLSSEFPNDNVELHLGTIWMSVEPCGIAVPHGPDELATAPPLLRSMGEGEETDEEEGDDSEPIEIVDSIAIDEPDEVVPAPAPPVVEIESVFPEEAVEAPPSVEVAEVIALIESVVPAPLPEPEMATPEAEVERAPAVPAPAASEVVLSSRGAEEIGAALAIPPPRVPDLDFDAAVEQMILATPSLAPAPPAEPLDPYAAFLRTLRDAAATVGASVSESDLASRLAGDPVAAAWRAILLAQSEDFSLCATTLDEWASVTLASFLDAPSKAAQLRRELRARGVAAFGLVEAA